MGLTGTPPTLVAPRSRGVINPKTGRPIGEDTALFAGITDELADKGFLVTAADESPVRRLTSPRRIGPWVRIVPHTRASAGVSSGISVARRRSIKSGH